jgi:hypothetical protein
MLNSARGISDKDVSPHAQAARRISSFADLDGLEFVAKVDIGTDTNGEEKNEIRTAVTPDHRGYAEAMGQQRFAVAPPAYTPPPVAQAPLQQGIPQGAFPASPMAPPAGHDPRPTWAR